jgi:hypothetical protein
MQRGRDRRQAESFTGNMPRTRGGQSMPTSLKEIAKRVRPSILVDIARCGSEACRGARCGNTARRDLCGGGGVIRHPTATVKCGIVFAALHGR